MFESSPLPCLQSPESLFFLNGAYSVSAGSLPIMDIWNDVHLFNVNLLIIIYCENLYGLQITVL